MLSLDQLNEQVYKPLVARIREKEIRALACPTAFELAMFREHHMPSIWHLVATFHPMVFGLEDPFIMEQIS